MAEVERRLEGELVSAHHWLAIVSSTHRFPDPCSNNWPGRPPVCMCAGILGFIADINGKLNILRSKTDEEGILVFYWWMVQTP